MRRYLDSAATAVMWFLALAFALGAARYFLAPVPGLERSQALALSRHHLWVLLHVAGGIVAITVGPFQFIGTLRDRRPGVHRAMGYVYLAAVVVAGCAGLRLSPDTRVFVAEGLNDSASFDLSFLGLSPAQLGFRASSTFSPDQFYPVMAGFTALGLVWLLTVALAVIRARQRRFDQHRAWMIRSYSLTFAAVTVRLIGFPLFVLTRDPVVAITATFWSWILNLMVAEWLIRRSKSSALRRLAQAAS